MRVTAGRDILGGNNGIIRRVVKFNIDGRGVNHLKRGNS